ncbi:MAG TPA: phosphatidylserine/phosphatidylglycerophosphate/cardiolipin synthase family protein [Burkholderiales bacterium]|nr:phosphatidylserine/phosphatidylglycerophosphate/cardiolipin synthase family protein [Burkholderiales bacterium]
MKPEAPQSAATPNRTQGGALEQWADHAFARAAGAELIPGNRARILCDADENYSAWLDAIRNATRAIFFETYIFANDEVGREFVSALAERARSGVRVRVLYDWFGTPRARVFAPLVSAGGVVRRYNPPRLDSPLGWLARDHRKMIALDGHSGFVSGLCVSLKWCGDSARGIDPWRDTGVEVVGPAVAELERAFADVWGATGKALPRAELTAGEAIPVAGKVPLRVIAGVPNRAGVFRTDQLVAALARERLWLTDAYFVGLASYVQALRAAARDGVDVRLLVPGASDVPLVSRLSRAGYRPLLEAGVRVFEWNGSMLHAKTAVADRHWARIGSTNLNIASWLSNCELDVAIEDEGVAAEMAALYERDLARSTEIVLGRRYRPHAVSEKRQDLHKRATSGSAGRAAAGALSVGNIMGAALANRRKLGPSEATLLADVAMVVAALAIIAALWPRLVAYPFAFIAFWFAGATLFRAVKLRRGGARARDNGETAARRRQ